MPRRQRRPTYKDAVTDALDRFRDRFTVADAYLVTMLNWAVFLKIDLAKWPTLAAYHQKHLKRPSVVQAMGIEMAERQRRAA